MQIDDELSGVSRLFLDTSPVIYFVERNPQFVGMIDPIFERLEAEITAVVSPVTIAECLVGALRLNLAALQQAYLEILDAENVVFVETSRIIAREAARIRLEYNFQLPDALQIATAIAANCDAFLTNDIQLKRVTELRVLVVGEMEA